MMTYTSLSDQGNDQNEDVVLATPLFGFVIDGASGLYPEKMTNYASDAQWFSQSLSQLLLSSLSDLSKPITTHVQVACDVLLADYQRMARQKKLAVDSEQLPNATLSILRFNEIVNQLEVFQLGDSPILIEQQGKLIILDDEVLEQNDQRVLTKMLSIAKERQISPKEARPFIQELLRENRRKRNTSAGYWILDPTGRGIEGAKARTYPLDQVTRLAIMSDGLWEAYDILKLFDSPQLLFERLFAAEGLVSLIDEMRVIQKSDPYFYQYPRFKMMDDASVLRYLVTTV